MLTPKTQYNLANAKTYFEEHLCVGDYYTEGERVSGHWFGQGAEMLGLAGDVQQAAFLRLCDNLHPQTNELLTQRRKTTRRAEDGTGNEQEVANRRVFYDFTISPPKSVSVVALIGGDQRIVEAHQSAVSMAMKELERFAETRVRSGGACSDRPTGNIVGAVFRHDTSRALDPHLHSHCILFNATFDPVERRWKALQNHEMLLARKYVENVYYHELTRELRRWGFEIENHARGDFEIRGVARRLCEMFSKRHAEIDERTRDLLAREPEKATGNVDDIRANIARDERSRKIKNVGMEQLRALWAGQMSDGARNELAALRGDVAASFDRLERSGAVVECGLSEQQKRLTADYLELTRLGLSTVVVAQTWSEIHKVNDAVRQALKSESLIASVEETVVALERIDLTDAQKRDKRFYDGDSVLVLNRDVAGFRRGETARFLGIGNNGVIVETDRKVGRIAVKHLDRVTVCRKRELTLAAGDRLQLKANATTADGRRLTNGELVTLHAVRANGEIALNDGRILPSDYRQFGRGYAVTSYASQGKTVDYVLFSDSMVKAATDAKQWYVSISRGRKGIRIFTSDKHQLRENVARSGNRALALDLAGLRRLPRQVLRQHRFRSLTRLRQFAAALRSRAAAWIASRRLTPVRQKIVTND